MKIDRRLSFGVTHFLVIQLMNGRHRRISFVLQDKYITLLARKMSKSNIMFFILWLSILPTFTHALEITGMWSELQKSKTEVIYQKLNPKILILSSFEIGDPYSGTPGEPLPLYTAIIKEKSVCL